MWQLSIARPTLTTNQHRKSETNIHTFSGHSTTIADDRFANYESRCEKHCPQYGEMRRAQEFNLKRPRTLPP